MSYKIIYSCPNSRIPAIIGIGCAQAAPRDFETTRLGRHILNLSGRTFMSTENACSLPPQPTNGNWEHHPLIRGGGEFCLFSVGILMEEGTHLLYTCDPGYRLEGRPVVRCMRRRWTAIPSCIRESKQYLHIQYSVPQLNEALQAISLEYQFIKTIWYVNMSTTQRTFINQFIKDLFDRHYFPNI